MAKKTQMMCIYATDNIFSEKVAADEEILRIFGFNTKKMMKMFISIGCIKKQSVVKQDLRRLFRVTGILAHPE